MYIDGFGISNYRSFGENHQRIGPFGKINLFIGQNNSGKSNILIFLHKHFNDCLLSTKMNSAIDFESVDRHLGERTGRFVFSVASSLENNSHETMFHKYGDRLDEKLRDIWLKILNSPPLSFGTKVAWFQYDASWKQGLKVRAPTVKEFTDNHYISAADWQSLWSALLSMRGGSLEHHWFPETLQAISPVHFGSQSINLIPAIRRIGDSSSLETENDFSGNGIIDRLAKLQNPPHDRQEDKHILEKITNFLKIVTSNLSAELEIPYVRDMIMVHMDGKTLPLSSLGTGIHEVIILAAAATILNNQIVCIEEPELHLHPLLQKKLVNYLVQNTDNQYFITTHSAHLLDTPDASIFHVRFVDGQSIVEPVYSADQKSFVCADLGYRASDILQSNCIIWVEGPSDRIYINHWIRKLAPKLAEGIHYSIMFYGGRLLNHLTADDREISEFISLRRINRNMIVVIDSDRSKSTDPINDTKNRILTEFGDHDGYAWVTQGREIENYINPDTLSDAIQRLYPGAVKVGKPGQYNKCLDYKKDSRRLDVDKIKLAREVVSSNADLSLLDLEEQVNRLIEYIHKSNGIDLTQ